MIHFIGNQYKALGPEGLFRARNFIFEGRESHTPGIIIGTALSNRLSVVTFTPLEEFVSEPWSLEPGFADYVVNKSHRAARYITSVLCPHEPPDDAHDFITP